MRGEKSSPRTHTHTHTDMWITCTNAGLIKVNTCERIQTKTNGSEISRMVEKRKEKEKKEHQGG